MYRRVHTKFYRLPCTPHHTRHGKKKNCVVCIPASLSNTQATLYVYRTLRATTVSRVSTRVYTESGAGYTHYTPITHTLGTEPETRDITYSTHTHNGEHRRGTSHLPPSRPRTANARVCSLVPRHSAGSPRTNRQWASAQHAHGSKLCAARQKEHIKNGKLAALPRPKGRGERARGIRPPQTPLTAGRLVTRCEVTSTLLRLVAWQLAVELPYAACPFS